jgi:hypothetical protein
MVRRSPDKVVPPRCYEQPDSNPPACAVHKVHLVSESTTIHNTKIWYLRCPVGNCVVS